MTVAIVRAFSTDPAQEHHATMPFDRISTYLSKLLRPQLRSIASVAFDWARDQGGSTVLKYLLDKLFEAARKRFTTEPGKRTPSVAASVPRPPSVGAGAGTSLCELPRTAAERALVERVLETFDEEDREIARLVLDDFEVELVAIVRRLSVAEVETRLARITSKIAEVLAAQRG